MFFLGFFRTRREELNKKPSKNGGRVLDPTLGNTTAFEAGNDAEILGNTAVSNFTFCVQGFALVPFSLLFLDCFDCCCLHAVISKTSEQ